ncbi:hypothetical protein [Pseudoxanthomonas winnipegensis]|uniref:Minor tail protein n=1 Tax=Pseudoxanthomonas winnipegensis TaxID=2480810 RepID=A0A4Q8M6G0_9GAMM|nr:hypothetical protein [Pseudoxanthomonas winnipegensis]TAA45645.1 hypothetical protein EA655_05510 [Pseudoxanthomonas winnipegensis]
MSRMLTHTYEVRGALEVSRNLGVLASRMPTIERRAALTLRRRLPVQARRDIQAEYNITAQRVNKDMFATLDGDRAVKLVGRFRGIGLLNFSARQTRKGVTYSVLRGQRSLLPGAFIATLANGNRQVVSRYGAKRVMTQGRYKGKRRQPIAVEYGATLAQMLGKQRRPERLADFACGVLRNEVERLLAYYDRGTGYLDSLTQDSP